MYFYSYSNSFFVKVPNIGKIVKGLLYFFHNPLPLAHLYHPGTIYPALIGKSYKIEAIGWWNFYVLPIFGILLLCKCRLWCQLYGHGGQIRASGGFFNT